MSSRHTPPRLGFRVPPPPPPRDAATEGEDESTLRAGDLLDGRYQIEDQVGEGGVGVVYRALQLKLHRRVAVKVLQQESDEEQRPRFEREAVTLAALSHPNIVSVQDYGHTRGKPFLVMELLAGSTLRDVLDREGALAVPRALALTRQVLHALAYAHSMGIVHRDLKPANLVVQNLPAYEHVKVLDFGFVKLLPGSYLDRGVQLSRVGFTFGTPAYMSPEHATGGEVDGRSDLYAMGILLFEMLTGSKPFEGELPDLIRHHLSTPVPRLGERHRELAGRSDLQALVERALAKPRDQRFPDAAAFLHALDELAVLPLRAGAGLTGPPTAGALANRPSDGLGVEFQRVAAALQRFARMTYGMLRERAGPLLRRTAESMRTISLQMWTKLKQATNAAVSFGKPRLLALRARLAAGRGNAQKVDQAAADPATVRLDPGSAPTIDLSDPRAQAELQAGGLPVEGLRPDSEPK